jgi:hypothetical protein
MHPLNALLEVSLDFPKFIQYKKPSGFGGSEALFSSLNMIQAERIIFSLLSPLLIDLMIDQGPPKTFLPRALQVLSAALTGYIINTKGLGYQA